MRCETLTVIGRARGGDQIDEPRDQMTAPQCGQSGGNGTSIVSSTVNGGRRCPCRPCRRPGWRPGDRLLVGMSPTDPVTFAATALLLTATTLVACYLPARRATRVNPIVTLRTE